MGKRSSRSIDNVVWDLAAASVRATDPAYQRKVARKEDRAMLVMSQLTSIHKDKMLSRLSIYDRVLSGDEYEAKLSMSMLSAVLHSDMHTLACYMLREERQPTTPENIRVKMDELIVFWKDLTNVYKDVRSANPGAPSQDLIDKIQATLEPPKAKKRKKKK